MHCYHLFNTNKKYCCMWLIRMHRNINIFLVTCENNPDFHISISMSLEPVKYFIEQCCPTRRPLMVLLANLCFLLHAFKKIYFKKIIFLKIINVCMFFVLQGSLSFLTSSLANFIQVAFSPSRKCNAEFTKTYLFVYL